MAYRSKLRADRQRETRLRILDAAIGLISDPASEEPSRQQIAARAGVGLRTVYRHFPTRAALIEAAWRLAFERLERIDNPDSPEQLPDRVAETFRSYDRAADLVTASLRHPQPAGLRKRGEAERFAAFERWIDAQVPEAPAEARRRALGVIGALATPTMWQTLRESDLVGASEAGGAAAWAIRMLVEGMRHDSARPLLVRATGPRR